MRRAHAWTGALWLLVFLASGAYMRFFRNPPVDQLDDVARALYRSRHLFLLAGAIANLALSSFEHIRPADRVISALVLLAPALFLAAFVTEPTLGIHAPSTWSQWGMYSLFGAAVLLTMRQLRK